MIWFFADVKTANLMALRLYKSELIYGKARQKPFALDYFIPAPGFIDIVLHGSAEQAEDPLLVCSFTGTNLILPWHK